MSSNFFIKPILVIGGFLSLAQMVTGQNKALSKKSPLNVKQIVSSMTLEEKARMLVGMGFNIPGMPKGLLPPTDPADEGLKEKLPGASGRMHGLSRKGLPVLTLADGPAGVHLWNFSNGPKTYVTAIPNATLLASTWDTTLVKKVGMVFGNEAKEFGIDILLCPAMNIQRNPLNGRNFEYYSEDPVLSGNISAAMVSGIQHEGVGVSVKHFVANNTETSRNLLNTIVSQRTLREIYLRGFEIAIKKSKPWTVMSSYNKVNGVYTSERKDLLTTILRDEWGYKGFVMSDWFGGKDPVAQINAGNNLIMPGNYSQTQAIVNAVRHDSISQEKLNKSVEQIINIIKLSPTYKKYPYSGKPDLASHARFTRIAAADGMVLLKNEDNTLPIKSSTKVALWGNSAYNIIAGGTGSGDVEKAYTVSIVEGLKNNGILTEEGLSSLYSQYMKMEKSKQPPFSMESILNPPPPISEMILTDSLLKTAIEKSDISILSIGRNAGEGKDRKMENDFNLNDLEKNNLKNLSTLIHAQNKKLVVVINSGSVIEIASWRDYADAILMAWQPGMEGGNAMADILCGKVNPSGKLPATFSISYTDVPSAKNFPGKELDPDSKPTMSLVGLGKPSEITYEEGIYLGYRYFNTFKVKPAYEFGYGLSYTHFRYSALKLSSPVFNHSLKASITITNTGKVAGKEVVQLYVSAPHGHLDKPSEELKGFAKTHLLKPGESQTLSFTLQEKDLASFDTPSSSWIAESGNYKVKMGASCLDIRALKEFSVSKTLVVEKVHDVLKPEVVIHEMKP